MKRIQSLYVALAFLLFVFAGTVEGQITTGTILGVVTDQSGAVVLGAKITITNIDTGENRTSITDNAGSYVLTALPVGRYSIAAELSGFKKVIVENVPLAVHESLRRNITMTVGEVEQNVTVQSERVALGTENPTIGEIITSQQIVDLPLNGRNFLQLATLSPGVTAPALQGGESAVARGTGMAVSISGQREYNSAPRYDGVPSMDFDYGTISLQLDPDSIAEFRVQRGYTGAESGVPGTINLVTKSGTNAFHGSAYEFLRNNHLDAIPYFQVGKPVFKQNQFGANGGGPILKNKLFVYGGFEQLHIRGNATSRNTYPTPAELSGNFSGEAPVIDPTTGQPFPGNIIPAGRISNFAQTFIKNNLIPTPNTTGSVNFISNPSPKTDTMQWSTRADYLLSEKDRFFGRFTYSSPTTFSPSARPLGGQSSGIHADNAVLSWDHIFTPRFLNSFKVGLNRTNAVLHQPEASNQVWRDVFGLKLLDERPICNQPPAVAITGRSAIGGIGSCAILLTNIFDYVDNVSVIRGRHTFNAGFEIQDIFYRPGEFTSPGSNFNFSGRYTKNATADFLLGIPTSALAGFVAGGTLNRRALWQSYYLNDELRLTPKLHASLGLRYDYFPSLSEDQHHISTFDPSLPGGGYLFEKGSGVNVPGSSSDGPQGLIYPDKNNWAPRIGLAYGPWNDSAIRMSYGIFYLPTQGDEYTFQNQGPPFIIDNQLSGGATTPTINIDQMVAAGTLFPQPTSTFRGPSVAAFGWDPHARTPYTQEWTLSVQHILPSNLLLEAAYVGSRGLKLNKRDDINVLPASPPPGFTGDLQSLRPFPDFAFILFDYNRGRSYYNSLQLSAKKSMGDGGKLSGLSFLAAYTFGKSLDMDSFDAKAIRSQVPYSNDLSRSTFDQRQRFVLSAVYDIPGSYSSALARTVIGGWQLSGITTLQSGFPFTVQEGDDHSNRLIQFFVLPDRVCRGDLPPSQRTPQKWFDTSCFTVPANNTIGNSRFENLDADGIISQDFALSKYFTLHEQVRLQFRSEFFNAFNHPNFAPPTALLESPNYGKVFGTSIPARQIQFALKLYW
jgi:hypothetical protein